VNPFELQLRTRLVFGAGGLARLGELAADQRFSRTLLVADPGMVACGYVERASRHLRDAGLAVIPFHDFGENPDGAAVARGADAARAARIDSLVGLGGGSSLDCAKGINFVLAGGGTMADYRGWARARGTMLPMIGVPTTAGTGSEAQSYALIADTDTHAKMACGDPGAAFRVALLDPELTFTLPAAVAAVTGYDALAHAVESHVCTTRNAMSQAFSREAWRLLEGHYERVLQAPDDLEARGAMLLGSYLAGLAIEASMLGAAHACANPLTARHGTTHGVAVGLMLPHVVRWNGEAVGGGYADLLTTSGRTTQPERAAEVLAARLEALAIAGGLPRTLRAAGVAEEDLPALAADAREQWTGRHNPRAFDARGALALYEAAW
jgi:alcohol dehydrogenase